MGEAEVFIASILQHDRIYDPVKAHDYYERTKHLVGRKPFRGKKQEGWKYVQAVVADRKKADLKKLSMQNHTTSQALHEAAKIKRQELTDKIKALFQGLSGDVKSQIAALPAGLSKADHAAAVANIRNEANKSKDANRSIRDGDKTKLAADLKSSVDNARAQYQSAREGIKAKYDAVLQSEYDALKNGSR